MTTDVIYPADIAQYPISCNCNCEHEHPVAPCPPVPPQGYVGCWCPPPPMPPHYPSFPCPVSPEEVPIKKQSPEEQLCILSKKSAVISAMIDAYKNKNCDAVIKINGVTASYNFGTYYDDVKEKTISTYGKEILEILELELTAIKEKISELATQIGEDTVETSYSAGLKTVTQE